MEKPTVTVAILTYQSAEHVVPCVESVLAQVGGGIELVVVDNASTDGSADIVEKRFPGIRVLRNSRNLGFARAHNRVIAEAKSDYYMPLNPDCRLESDFLERLLRAVQRDAQAGYATGKMLFAGTTSPPRIYSTGHVLLTDGTVRNRGYGEVDHGAYDEASVVWGANGAAPLYSMSMLRALAISRGMFFDELFFVYGEDVDMDWRAHWRRFRCVYEPAAVAHHAAGGSAGLDDRRLRRRYFRNARIAGLMNAPLAPLARRMIVPMIADWVRYGLGDPLGAALNAAEVIAAAPLIAARRRDRVVPGRAGF